jgi:phosphatidylglycerophosphate synthase
MQPSDSRRPIPARSTGWAQACARWLAQQRVRPNAISLASIGFAAVAGLALWAVGGLTGAAKATALVLAGLAVGARLLANMFDGMVAVEGGLREPDGAFWNEMPDRAADVLILVGLGYGVAGLWPPGDVFGWLAAVLALVCAYVRELGARLGMEPDFSGPGAKPHRMGIVIAGCAFGLFEGLAGWNGVALVLALVVVNLATAATVVLRSRRLLGWLKDRP